MKRSDLDLFFATVIFIVLVITLVVVWRSTRIADCGSFGISAYRLGNVPARCAGYLID